VVILILRPIKKPVRGCPTDNIYIIYGQVYQYEKNSLVCPICDKEISKSNYSRHIEKCQGIKEKIIKDEILSSYGYVIYRFPYKNNIKKLVKDVKTLLIEKGLTA